MVAVPRYVATAPEAAARIAGLVFGDGNPDVQDNQLGGPAFTCIAVAQFQTECQRCAGVIGWLQGTHWRLTPNGNFRVLRSALYTALGITSPSHNLYYRALEPTATYTPTRVQVEAFLAGVIETEGQAGSTPPKVFDEGRGGTYDQRIDAVVLTLNTQNLGAFRSGVGVRVNLAQLDAFPIPLISLERYPGSLGADGQPLADWPDGPPAPPDTTPPAVPTGLTAVAGHSSVGLSWTVNTETDLAGYRLYRDGFLVFTGATPAFLDTGLANELAYSYTVLAFDTTGNASAQSSAVIGTPTAGAPPPGDSTPPDIPTNLTATPSATQVSLAWTASVAVDLVSYRVYRAAELIATVAAPSTFYVDTGRTPETTYTYRVSAVDSSGNESTSTDFVAAATLTGSVDPPLITQTPIAVVDRFGCAESYEVFIAHRSGWPLLAQVPQTGGSWNRVIDEISEAEIRLDMANRPGDCCGLLSGLVRWGYEIVVFRDGGRVWTGPLVDIITDDEDVRLRALDKMAWTTRRPIWSLLDYPEPGIEIAEIFNDVIENAMAPDNVPGLVPTATATGVRASRRYETNPPQYAWEAVSELARTGVDFTMIGPEMIAGSFVVPTPPIAFLTDQSLAGIPGAPRLGENVTTQWFVTGDPDQNLLATYGGIDPLVGLLVSIAQEDEIRDQESLDQNARSRWELTNNPDIGEATFTLDPFAPLPLHLAVPGAVIDLRLGDTCLPVIGRHRLKRLDVSWTSSDDGMSETGRVTVEPVGTELIA